MAGLQDDPDAAPLTVGFCSAGSLDSVIRSFTSFVMFIFTSREMEVTVP